MGILFNNYGLIIRSTFVALLFFCCVNSSYAAFTINTPANASSTTYGATITLTINNAPGGTKTIDYFAGTTLIGTSTNNFTNYSATNATLVPGVYSITAKALNNGGGTVGTTAAITITVFPAAPSVTPNSSCGTGPIALTATGLPSGGTYSWYTVPTGGTAITGATTGTYTPTDVITTTYYVSYTDNAETSARSAVIATVNPIVSSPLAGAIFSYPLNGNANDVSGNGDNGTLQAAPTATTDRYGNANSAYNFNGTTQYISTATPSASPGPQNFSISVWFKTTTGGGMLVGYGSSQTGLSSSYDRHIYMSNTGQIYYGIYPNAVKTINTTGTYIDGNWHQVVATTSTTNGSNLYVDGVLQATDVTMTTSQVYGVNGYWRVGYDNLLAWTNAPTDDFFKGTLDDISVYNSELSATDVANSSNLNLIGATAIVCAGTPITLNAPTITGATYSWQDASGTTATSQNPTFASAVVGNYTLTVIAGGCTSTATVTPTINAAPSATFTATSAINTGGTATVTYTGTDPATSTYAWTFTGGSPSTGTGQGSFSVTYSTAGTYTIGLTVTNSNGCSFTSTQTVTVTAPLSNYVFSKPITLNTSLTGIAAATTLTDFPALVYIQDNSLIIGTACANSVQFPNGDGNSQPVGTNYDFAFTVSGSSAELNYQVENYNQTTGTLLVWVQVPSVTSTNTSLVFYFGSKTPAHTAATAAATWNSNYLAVYHFNEGSTSASVLDATTNAYNATQANTALGVSEIHNLAGLAGGAYTFNGTSTKITSNATPTSLTGSFTLSAWVKVTSFGTSGTYDQKIVTTEAASGDGGYKLGLYGGTSNTDVLAEVETRNAAGAPSDNRAATGGTPLSAGTWYYVQGIYNGAGKFLTYRNGVQDRTINGAVAATAGSVILMGVDFGSSGAWLNGTLSEVRISNVAQTADWIKAEYYNQTNPTTFTNYSGSVATDATNAALISGAVTYTWTGNTSTDPAVAGNWNNTTAGTSNQLPSFNGTASLVIPTGLTNYPSLTANASLYGLTIASGASLNLNGFTLSVGCNIYNSTGGQILYGTNNTSGITWNGSAATQTYNGTGTTNTAELGSMTINNSAGGTVTISGGPVDIYNQLTITKGNLVVGASPAALTLKSTAALTASVAAIPSGYSITGLVNVERYITGNNSTTYRGYRLFSSPVNVTSPTSGINYISLSTLNVTYGANYGVFTAGPGTGFSFVNANPIIYFYKEANATNNTSYLLGKNVGVKSILAGATNNITLIDGNTYSIPVGNGYLLYFIGSTNGRTTGATTLPPDNTTVTNVGYLNQQNVTFYPLFTSTAGNLSYTGSLTLADYKGYNMVGNPYASTIDLNKLYTDNQSSTNNIGPNFYELNDQNPNQNYVVWDADGTNSGAIASEYIASGQGFFIQASATGQTLTFKEDQKVSVSPSPLLLASPNKALSLSGVAPSISSPQSRAILSSGALKGLHLKLGIDSLTYDECGIYFSGQWADNFDINDAYDLGGVAPQVSMSSFTGDGVRVSINKMGDYMPKGKRIKLYVKAVADGNYNLKMTDIANIDTSLFNIYLVDNMNRDSLDIVRYKTYVFTITNADTNSYGANRFVLDIDRKTLPPYQLVSFGAQKVSDGVQLTWKTTNEGDYTGFGIQKLDASKQYVPLYNVQGNGDGLYNYIDHYPVTGTNTYRLQQIDIDSTVSYSKSLNVLYNVSVTNSNLLSIYPNPARELITINFNSTTSATTDSYVSNIYNSAGELVMQQTANSNTWTQDVSSLKPGAYIIQIKTSNGNLIGNTKFVRVQ